MTFYDDAEFYAIKLARLAHAEEESDSKSAEIVRLIDEIEQRHGQDGVNGLVVALSRHYGSALSALATAQDTTVTEILDRFEQGKLEQHVTEDEV